MVDTTALAALIVAAAALLVAGVQVTQQLLSTAYVIRKCDRIVTGGLTKGGTRQWHWRQFRFTVNYQALIFTLPQSVHKSLGISSTIQVNPPSEEIWARALKSRLQRSSGQACWVSRLQDMVQSSCLTKDDICTREESGDRIPDDLNVAPSRVDCLTVLLSCIAMGMQVFKYSPTTGEMTLGGGVGSISSSVHPVLGGLLHYSVFADEPTIGWEVVKRHGRALCAEHGVWANALFGRFRDRSYRAEMVSLRELMTRKFPVLREQGWPEDEDTAGNRDTIGGAACFMAFGYVDAYESVPPSVARSWSAHFAETIVKAHHVECLKRISERGSVFDEPSTEYQSVERKGYSSPYDAGTFNWVTNSTLAQQFVSVYDDFMLLPKGLLELSYGLSLAGCYDFGESTEDPSSYCSPAFLWDFIRMADYHISLLKQMTQPQGFTLGISMFDILARIDQIVARSIKELATAGAPSWGESTEIVRSWPQTFFSASEEILNDVVDDKLRSQLVGDDIKIFHQMLRLLAGLILLRSAYYTVMMRAAHPIGPGLTEDSSIETALAYMA